MTTELIPMAAQNTKGEHLDNVDIHLAITEELVTINIHAITSERDEDGFPMEDTGRKLLTITSTSEEPAVFEDWRSSRHLTEAIEDGWPVTQMLEKLIGYAVEAGLNKVEADD